MVLEGVVTNVTAFGAFVDIGVHQDGLVHVSQLADRFVKDPREVVKVGDSVKVRVLEVDLARKRIALTIKQAAAPDPKAADSGFKPAARGERVARAPAPQAGSAMADAFAKLRSGRGESRRRAIRSAGHAACVRRHGPRPGGGFRVRPPTSSPWPPSGASSAASQWR